MPRSKERVFTYKIPSDKESKNLIILELIRKKSPISRTDISKIAKINIVSVSNYVNNFIKKELVLEGGLDISSGGRRPELLELNKKAGFAIGLSLVGKRIKGALTDLSAEIVSKEEKSIKDKGLENLQEGMLSLIEALINKSGKKDAIKAIGLGFSGVPDEPEAEIYYDKTLFSRLGKAVEDEFKIDTFSGEDFVCGAFAEKNLNPKIETSKFLFIYSDLGTGVYVEDYNFYTPTPPLGGEILEETPFYYLRPWRPRLGIVHRARGAVEKGIGTKIVEMSDGDKNKISVDTVIKAANEKDGLARDLIESTALTLGVRVAYLVNLFNPEVVAVGGGIEKAGDLFLKPLRESVGKLVHKSLREKLKVLPGACGEDQVMLGAAGLAVREIFIGA